ncbi:NAD(P)-binding protein [Lentithecium fluviatile CBS 122367]|uniref:Short-chain dehydrogenase/reductase 3 n=1 Tax=Lentithecium fluviatile CBS 122367 TaxID=1168545 RepID=A0A6G1JHL9_9PLEO|nr:NAD(P)-binding protein [Lentithecium fluviatile CBS 122367]
MHLARCLVVAAAYLALLAGPASSGSPKLLPLSEDQSTLVLRILRWVTGLLLVREINCVLNQWAENRWVFRSDESAWDWKNEVAVVTGGSAGIGAIVVKKLLSHGIRVAVLDVQPLADAFQQDERNRISLYRCNIASPEEVHMAAEAVRSDHGSPSILINNAGIGNAGTILEMTPTRLQTLFGVNLLSHWYTIQEFLPDMIAKRKGHVMSTSSMSAWVAFAGAAEYAATKTGLTALHESLTQELKHRYKCPQIKTSIVYPTWTRTRLITSIEKGIQHAKQPIMDPEEVAEAMVKQIIAAKSGQILLGPSIATAIRAFPIWLQETIRDGMGQVVTGNATTAVPPPPRAGAGGSEDTS